MGYEEQMKKDDWMADYIAKHKLSILEELIKMDAEKIASDSGPFGNVFNSCSNWNARQSFIKHIGFAVPCIELKEEFENNHGMILEVACGTGYMSKVARNIVTTDLCTEMWEEWFQKENTFGKIMNIDGLAAYRALKHKISTVLMSWPYMEEQGCWFNQLLDEMEVGHKLIYIGESAYGCTGNKHMFTQFDANFEEERVIYIPSWQGINDYVRVLKKVKNEKIVPCPNPLNHFDCSGRILDDQPICPECKERELEEAEEDEGNE